MKKLIIIVLVLITSASLKAYSLDTTTCHYFPLQVGNKFYYRYFYSSVITFEITKDTILNNKKYYYFSNFPYCGTRYGFFVRYDSLTGNFVNNNNQILFLPGYGNNSNPYESCTPYVLTIIKDTIIFNKNTSYKKYYYYGANIIGYMCNVMLAKDIGMIFREDRCWHWMGFNYTWNIYTLIGAKINGILYGDTSLVSVRNTNKIIPNNFSLSQNYPNPFNPTTTISYKVKNYKVIKLVVYDILGKDVAVLVNENQSPGEYEVQFPNNALTSNQLPSGVYFYTLYADGERIDTKKMVLLK